MKRMILLLSLLATIGVAQAETVKGRIAVVSQQAGTIQISVGGEGKAVSQVVVRTDANTRYEGASGLKDLGPPDLIEVQREPDRPASSIKKIVFGLPPGVEIDVRELLAVMTGGAAYHLFDARPGEALRRGARPRRPISLPEGPGISGQAAGGQGRPADLLLRWPHLSLHRPLR